MMESEFEVGDKVLLQLGLDAKYAPKGLKRWEGCVFTIDKVKCLILNSRTPNYYRVYTLKCCRSPKGVSYTILEEWMTKIVR